MFFYFHDNVGEHFDTQFSSQSFRKPHQGLKSPQRGVEMTIDKDKKQEVNKLPKHEHGNMSEGASNSFTKVSKTIFPSIKRGYGSKTRPGFQKQYDW